MRNATIDVRPVTGGVGAEIGEIDLAGEVSAQTWAELRGALVEHGVIFFRDQTLTPERQMAFARAFGTISVNPYFQKVAGYPEIEEVRKEPAQTNNFGGNWHTDQSFREHPTRGTILLARELPPHGGDTMFVSTARAYEGLSDGLKRTLEGLRAIHSETLHRERVASGTSDDTSGIDSRPMYEATHPVVIRVPETGRKALYVNPGKTVRFEGWSRAESQGLLDFLYQHALRPEFGCRFSWRDGSMAFWDNLQTWHNAVNDYQGERRVMHRITIEMEGALGA